MRLFVAVEIDDAARRRRGGSTSSPSTSSRAVRDAPRAVTLPLTRSHVSRATIFQSHLSPKGPRYEPVAFTPLNPEAAS